mgnify:CR=1 FL=1
MSADNWAICPKCKHEAEKELAVLAQQVAEGYGVLPIDEFDTLRTKLAGGIDEESLRTYREDYEFYGAEDGVITASYSGHCDKCKVGLDFEEKRGFYDRDPL